MRIDAHALAIVAVCALVTLLLRALPFLCFGGRRGAPKAVLALGRVLPPAIMAALVVYCLKGEPTGTAADGIRQLAAVAAVVGLHLRFRNTLLSVGAGTALYMALLRL